MVERVRAVLVTPGGRVLAIRRDRPSHVAWWVLPGRHVHPGDERQRFRGNADLTDDLRCRASRRDGSSQSFG